MAAELEATGHQVAGLALESGDGVLDEYVDVPPYVDQPHLTIWLKTYATTPVALVIRAGAGR